MFTEQTGNGTETIDFSAGNAKSSEPTQTTESENGTIEYSPVKKTEVEEPGKETNQETQTTEVAGKEEVAQEKQTETETQSQSQTQRFKVKRPETEVKTETTKTEANKETYSVTDESVINYLKTKGLEIKSLDEVTKKQELPSVVAEFKKFHEETGRGMKAYYNANKDWKAEPKNNTLAEYYKHQNPNSTDESIKKQIDYLYPSEEEREEMLDRDLKRLDIESDKEYSKALNFMEDLSGKYNIPKEDVATSQKPPTPEQIEEAHRPWREQRDKSLEKLNEISLPIEGLGDIKLPITQEHKDLIVNATQTEASFFDRWRDEKGNVDSDKSSLDTAWGIQEIRDQLISDMLSEAHVLFMEEFSKDKRNVTLGKNKIDVGTQPNGSMTVFSGKNDSGSTMGKPLIPAR